ncbi:hypothetical protein [Laribacter hongkongensis]|nr:hypothetical protein [Laribacter hongkongensis]
MGRLCVIAGHEHGQQGQAMADALFTAVARFHVMAEQQAAGR